MAFFVVGLGEELLKYLVVVLYAFRKPSFNEPFDGIVYAVMVSLGFAAFENIIYVMEGGLGVAIAWNVYCCSHACRFCGNHGILHRII